MTTAKVYDSFFTHWDGVSRDERGICNEPRSVLQDWVMRLPLRYQGTLLTAIRGCDLTPKFPLESIERRLTAFIRCSVMVAFDIREIDVTEGAFMRSDLPANWSASAFGHYPLHFVTHVMHALEIIGYYHPIVEVAESAQLAYGKFVHSLHLVSETRGMLKARLTEDRIANNSVVG